MKKLKLGMIGGGDGSFIGAIHRNAAYLDNCYELVCGSFSRDFNNSLETGKKLFLNPKRIYKSYEDMIDQESKIDSSIRMDVVSIVTPNHVHFDPAFKALNNGFPVIIDKPMTYDSNEALKLVKVVNETGLPFAVTHTYTGYPMVKEAKQLIADGKTEKLSGFKSKQNKLFDATLSLEEDTVRFVF